MNFEKYVNESNHFLKELASQLGNPQDTDLAFRVTRTVFHALRKRIVPEESMNLVAQLPMLLKAVYVDGWNINQEISKSKTFNDFLQDARSISNTEAPDFTDDEIARIRVKAVFQALRKYVSDGELVDIISELPQEIAELVG